MIAESMRVTFVPPTAQRTLNNAHVVVDKRVIDGILLISGPKLGAADGSITTTRSLVSSFRTAVLTRVQTYDLEHRGDVLSVHLLFPITSPNYGLDGRGIPYLELRFPTVGPTSITRRETTLLVQKKAKPWKIWDRRLTFLRGGDSPSPTDGSKRKSHAGGGVREHSLRGNLGAATPGCSKQRTSLRLRANVDQTNSLGIDAVQLERVRNFANAAVAKLSVRRNGGARLMIQKTARGADIFTGQGESTRSFLPCVWSRLQYDCDPSVSIARDARTTDWR
ncbi:hypothetical protein BDM02DRAFT_3260614 [Thelephora ganbajun]|uniref:Uncharacterized protein n=1 Tax=Thelephora ganbajun TaxID=370292 RepID=A0ACB6ZHL2_THEGA|nr:hypothetical protein BDM02DRAFT_3260614 [Thelephora ganbajun]